jgi:hypothetical protein
MGIGKPAGYQQQIVEITHRLPAPNLDEGRDARVYELERDQTCR